MHSAICSNLFGVVIFHTSLVDWSEVHLPYRYMCILLYVKLIQCSGIALGSMVNWRRGSFGICAFCCIVSNLFDVAIFHTSMVYWEGGTSALQVYVHSAICETYLVQWYSIDLW